MRIAFFEVKDWEIPHLQAKLPEHETSFHQGKLHDSDPASPGEIDVLSVFIYLQVTAEILAKFPQLRQIVRDDILLRHENVVFTPTQRLQQRRSAVAHFGHDGRKYSRIPEWRSDSPG